MPWKLGGNTIKEGRGWVHNNIQHPKTWMRYSDDLKKQYGLTWEDPPASAAPYDNRFYWGRQTNGTLIPKSLTDVNEVDEDGKALLDANGKQIVTLGLKSVWIEKTKQEANSLLANTDWYITRNAEKSTAIPSSITTYRDAVRTKCGEIETALNGAKDLAAFIKLFEDERNSDGTVKTVAKIDDWPDEV
tara:strand:- start:155 stop:721 length:567 start_codon:yes stop_codon:yes gene_type:complete